MNIYSYVLELYLFEIFFHFFFNISRCIFKYKFIVYKVLYIFFLPDVATSSIAPYMFVSLVLCVTCTVFEDDKANKV